MTDTKIVKIVLMMGEREGDTVDIRHSDGRIHRYRVVRVDSSGLFQVGYLEEVRPPNPIVMRYGRWYNTITKRFLSKKYGERLHSYFERFPDGDLKDARGHCEQVRPDEVSEPDDRRGNGGVEGQSLRIWSRRNLERLGVL